MEFHVEIGSMVSLVHRTVFSAKVRAKGHAMIEA